MTSIIKEIFGISSLHVLRQTDDIYAYMESEYVQEKIYGEHRRHRKYYEKKRHLRLKILKLKEAIRYYEEMTAVSNIDYSARVKELQDELKRFKTT